MFIDFQSRKNCYAPMNSPYSMCGKCNCCGRFGKGLKMYEARLKYNKKQLAWNRKFKDWSNNPDAKKCQEANIEYNIDYYKRRIKITERKIEKLKP